MDYRLGYFSPPVFIFFPSKCMTKSGVKPCVYFKAELLHPLCTCKQQAPWGAAGGCSGKYTFACETTECPMEFFQPLCKLLAVQKVHFSLYHQSNWLLLAQAGEQFHCMHSWIRLKDQFNIFLWKVVVAYGKVIFTSSVSAICFLVPQRGLQQLD